jgi:hypothetical protein
LELPRYSVEEMQNFIKSHPENVMNVPMIEKLARLFNYNLDGSKKEEAPAATTPAAPVVPEPPATKKGFFSRLFSRK